MPLDSSTKPRRISPARVRRVGAALLAAIFTAVAGVATNRVQGTWWTQALFFTASVLSLFVAAVLAGTATRRFPQPRKARKARQRVVTKVLPSHYRHEKPIWPSDGLLTKLSIPTEYEAINCESRPSAARYTQHQSVTSVQDAYNYSGGQLLILGDAGSGKTHALFQIIENALAQCAKDQDCPIPFYIDLTAWDSGSSAFDRWCISYINRRYRISEDYVKYWMDESDISLICDGLDELSRKQRVACISAINRFRQGHGLISVAVTSRSHEYAETAKRLQLNGCLYLKPLTVSGVLAELANFDKGNAGISEKIVKDSRLRDLLRTPLFLSLFVQAYYGDSTAKIIRRGQSWRRTIIDAYLDQAEQRGMARYRGVDLGLRSWLPPIIRQMKAQRQTVIYPDRLPRTQLDSQLKSQVQHRAAFIATAIVAFVLLAVRIPTLIAIRHDPAFPGFIIGSIMLIPATCLITWKYCNIELSKPIIFRYRFKKGVRLRVFVTWVGLYGILGSLASGLSKISPGWPLMLLFMIGSAAVAAYPWWTLIRAKEVDADALPRYPGEEVRSLVSFNLIFTGLIATCQAISIFAVITPQMSGSKILSFAASAYVIPYFLAPFALVSWIGSGGASVIYIFVARNIQRKSGLLPAKYMASFRALRSSSILIPASGGYSLMHSLVRDHLAARTETVVQRGNVSSRRALEGRLGKSGTGRLTSGDIRAGRKLPAGAAAAGRVLRPDMHAE